MANTEGHKPSSFTTKPTNQLRSRPTRQLEQRRTPKGVPEMSPEARRAVLLAREDTKTSNDNSLKKGIEKKNIKVDQMSTKDSDKPLHYVDTNNNALTNKNNENSENFKSLSSSTTTSVRNTRVSISSSRPPRAPKTARSRSTTSQNEPPFSLSDNNELSSYLGTNTNSNASVYTSNLSTNNNHNSNNINSNSNRLQVNYAETNVADDDDNDSALPIDDSFDEDDDAEITKDSFVLALDKALEKNYVCRLKGDITDTTKVSKPGTVRALNGGRLTNAQEVVVNVCHNDDTELVFHDDDEESIDTAKAISEIRVNIWMEYNSRFPQDDIASENDNNNDVTIENISAKKQTPPLIQSQGRGGSVKGVHRSREKTTLTVVGNSDKRISNSKERAGSKDSVPKNSNIVKSASNSRLRNVPHSPASSHHSSSGSNNRSRNKNATSTSKSKPTPKRKPRR